MLAAIETRWPQAELHQCEWHLQHALDRLLAKEIEAATPARRDCTELRAIAPSRALVGPIIVAAVRRGPCPGLTENESLERWIAVKRCDRSRTQFARRALTSRRAPDMPLTTAALEQLTRPITRGALSASLRAQEPRAPEPPADALAAARQRRRRRPGLRHEPSVIHLELERMAAPSDTATRDRRSRRIILPAVIAQREARAGAA